MSNGHVCFVVIPFKSEFEFFFLYLQKHLQDTYGLKVERGDQKVLTIPLLQKISDQICKADVIIADITGKNANVFYEIGLAHAYEKPVIFLTQDPPETAPVDIRQFEFIHYTFSNAETFLKKLNNAVCNVFSHKYVPLYKEAIKLLRKFNDDTHRNFKQVELEVFQSRVIKGEQTQGIPKESDLYKFAEFLLPKIISDMSDLSVMHLIIDWLKSLKISSDEKEISAHMIR